MPRPIIECLVSRSSTKRYDLAVTLSDDQIHEPVRIATTAPTSSHIRNWRFIAVSAPEAKARLRPIAWDQPKITDAAISFIVCGQLADSSVIPKRLAPVMEADIMPAEMAPDWENAGRRLYFEQPQRQRDEAVRTDAIGATALIYPAHALGLGSTPIICLDTERVAYEFALAEDEVPVMLLSVGAALPENWPQETAPSGGRVHCVDDASLVKPLPRTEHFGKQGHVGFWQSAVSPSLSEATHGSKQH